MKELIHLLFEWQHWAFEIISGGVFVVIGWITPEGLNPAKRWLARHDRDKHPQAPPPRHMTNPYERVG